MLNIPATPRHLQNNLAAAASLPQPPLSFGIELEFWYNPKAELDNEQEQPAGPITVEDEATDEVDRLEAVASFLRGLPGVHHEVFKMRDSSHSQGTDSDDNEPGANRVKICSPTLPFTNENLDYVLSVIDELGKLGKAVPVSQHRGFCVHVINGDKGISHEWASKIAALCWAAEHLLLDIDRLQRHCDIASPDHETFSSLTGNSALAYDISPSCSLTEEIVWRRPRPAFLKTGAARLLTTTSMQELVDLLACQARNDYTPLDDNGLQKRDYTFLNVVTTTTTTTTQELEETDDDDSLAAARAVKFRHRQRAYGTPGYDQEATRNWISVCCTIVRFARDAAYERFEDAITKAANAATAPEGEGNGYMVHDFLRNIGCDVSV